MTNMSIQPLWLTYFIQILLVLEFQLTKTYFGMFSYKAHFRPQISSNDDSGLQTPSPMISDTPAVTDHRAPSPRIPHSPNVVVDYSYPS